MLVEDYSSCKQLKFVLDQIERDNLSLSYRSNSVLLYLMQI